MSIMKAMFGNRKFAVRVIGKVKNPDHCTTAPFSSDLTKPSAFVKVCTLFSDKTDQMDAMEDCCEQFDKKFPNNLGRYADFIEPIAEHKHRMSTIKTIHDYFKS